MHPIHRILPWFFIVPLAIASDPDSNAAKPADVDIANLRTLPGESRDALMKSLAPAAFRKLDPAKRLEIQRAAVRFSETAIGRRPDGHLLEVTDAAEKRTLQIAGEYLNSLPPGNVPAHAKAGDLFGSIPSGAPRIARNVEIDPRVPRWHSTGLYAAPGEVVVVAVPKNWENRGLKVRLSGHTDSIHTDKKLTRLPTPPSRVFDVASGETRVASAFGGAIYLITGDKPVDEPAFSIRISNAVSAPHFRLGKTTAAQWKQSLRSAPAPYAELESGRIALSLPSSWIRELDDPTEVVRYWDRVVELHDELGGLAGIRKGPERVNVDAQISVGLFHAGYPMQGPQRQCRGVVDLAELRSRGNWGWFHELGHEAQRRPDKAWGWNNPYTFDGSIECTVNLFSAHAFDRLDIHSTGGWSWTRDPAQVAERARKMIDAKKTYTTADVGTKLAMFLQLRDAFGWKNLGAVLRSYSDDQDRDPGLLPKTEQEKRDQFLVRCSRQVKRDLHPFLHGVWGIEISPDARAKTAQLPAWMPEGFAPGT